MFVDSLGFSGIEITGTFDGVLPMIFDESGGRIVGGRLDSRAAGGELKYTGTKPDRAWRRASPSTCSATSVPHRWSSG